MSVRPHEASTSTPGKPPFKRGKTMEKGGNEHASSNNLHEKMDYIMKKLDKLDMIEKLVSEIQELKHSLEYAHAEIQDLKTTNREIQNQFDQLADAQAKSMSIMDRQAETILDIQSRSMRDNLIFSGIEEKEGEDTEQTLQNFLQKELGQKDPVSFERVHRMGKPNAPRGPKHRPIIAKFSHFKKREEIKMSGRMLKGKPFGINEQYPTEIFNRRKALLPILRQAKKDGKKATLSGDRLFINGSRYIPSQEESVAAMDQK